MNIITDEIKGVIEDNLKYGKKVQLEYHPQKDEVVILQCKMKKIELNNEK